MKKCPRCKEEKPFEDYHKDSSKKSGVGSYCKVCACLYRAEYEAKNKEKIKAYKKKHGRRIKLKHKYGITLEDYNRMLINQNHSCAICNSKETKCSLSDNLYVDHCHETNKVRGLLCHDCNRGLGAFEDNITSIENAIRYLNENK